MYTISFYGQNNNKYRKISYDMLFHKWASSSLIILFILYSVLIISSKLLFLVTHANCKFIHIICFYRVFFVLASPRFIRLFPSKQSVDRTKLWLISRSCKRIEKFIDHLAARLCRHFFFTFSHLYQLDVYNASPSLIHCTRFA